MIERRIEVECSICKGPMKPLLTGFYCPSECDLVKKSTSNKPNYGRYIGRMLDVYGNVWEVYRTNDRTTIENMVFGWWTPDDDIDKIRNQAVSNGDYIGWDRGPEYLDRNFDKYIQDYKEITRFIPISEELKKKYADYL